MELYHIQMHLPYGREDGTYLDPRKMLNEDTPVIGTGEWENIQCKHFKSAKIGSIVFVREGNTPIALVEIISDNFQDEALQRRFLHSNFRKVKILAWAEKNRFPRAGLFSQGTFKRCVREESEQFCFINSWYNQTIKDKNMNTIKKLLLNNFNLILTGAPGTGKTYLAKQIAQQMIFGETKDKMTPDEEKQFNERCGFVQFHPSYDYTDFVEGLRPVQDECGNVGFKLKDGYFKAFCKKALLSQKASLVDNFDESWNKLVEYMNDNDVLDVPFISNNSKTFRVELNEYGTGLANRTYLDNNFQKGEWIKGQSKFFNKEQLYNIYKGGFGVPSGGHDNYRRAIVEIMKSKFGLHPYNEGDVISDKGKHYVFIIDEINRGEISKIFGELFFSIDPGYRVKEKGVVKTQYQNLVEQGDVFYDGFYVPENVYIIGTMNDIDRSVESMDFAFRRRFAFKEITAKETQNMLDKEESWKDEKENPAKPDTDTITKIKNRMDNLNNVIWDEKTKSGIEGLSSAYHIGASYFLKLANYRNNGTYDDSSFKYLWDYHLEGLLREYLRGMQDVETNINKLKKAYGYSSESNND